MRKASLLGLLLLGACASTRTAPQQPAAAPTPLAQAAPQQVEPWRPSGRIADARPPRPSASYGTGAAVTPPPRTTVTTEPNGTISLNFADTDIRAVVAQILGGILHVNYTIDSGVSGTVTLQTTQLLTQAQLLPTLQTLLAQHDAVLVQANGLYRVMPSDQSSATPPLARDNALGGAVVVKLRYAVAASLADVLKPYVGRGGSLTAEPGSNSLIVQGDPATRAALTGLVAAFDTDALASQSYELFPVQGGNAKDFADAFTAALGKDGAEGVTVTPLDRIGAVLAVANTRRGLEEAARLYSVIDRVQMEAARSWHVYYLRNSRANDAAYLLQQAFTPDDVTAQPTPPATGQASATLSNQSDSGTTGATGTGTSSTTTGSTATGSASSTATTGQTATSGASALLGPLSATSTSGGSTQGIRIIPDIQNNSLLVYSSVQEDAEIQGVLSKIDIMPLEVRIDATIAEVDLTGQLQYGTQFFFKSGGINAVLSNSSSSSLSQSFPGFVLSGHGADGAPLAISALQAVTKVNVLSSPELVVQDGQAASLQVGDLVPYLAQTSQDTSTAGAPVINSVDYRETGVILHVTPHVGNDGLVTMDIDQEVSGVASGLTTTGINSPTFTEREVTSRVAIQDGQTVGLAGLISDNDSHGNQGLPWLKNVPLLGDLFGSQNNQRTRQEMLVLITPHVIGSQQQALDLTQDMMQALPAAAMVPRDLRSQPEDAASDPDEALRAGIPQ